MSSLVNKPQSYPFYVVDAFSDDDLGLAGNPVAVVWSVEELSADLKKKVARKLNQVATAFLSHPFILSSEFPVHCSSPLPSISWYSAAGKTLPLCGHATMGTSILLFEKFPSLQQLVFKFPKLLQSEEAVSIVEGHLQINRAEDGRAQVALPASRRHGAIPDIECRDIVETIQAATGLDSEHIQVLERSPSNDPSMFNLLVQLSPIIDMQLLDVDIDLLTELPSSYRGIYFTSLWPNDSNKDSLIRSRVFFPSVGIPEDQVCGSAHTLFAPYWICARPEYSCKQEDGLFSVESQQVSSQGGRIGMLWDGKWGEDGGICLLLGRGKVRESGQIYLGTDVHVTKL